MIASVQPDKKPWPLAAAAARPVVNVMLNATRIKPSGPRTPPSCRPTLPDRRPKMRPTRPRTSTRLLNQRSSASTGSLVMASTTSEARYRPAVVSGGNPASRAISTPIGIPPLIGGRQNNRNTPSKPLGQLGGKGANGSTR